MWAIFITWMGLLVSPAAAKDLVLVRNGKPKSVVIVPNEASPAVTYAAEEFVAHVAKITGVSLRVVDENDKALGDIAKRWIRIYIGDTQRSKEQAFDIGAHGFLWKTAPGEVMIIGDDSPGSDKVSSPEDLWDRNGTLSGVYDLLQDEFGVRWFWPGELGTVAPKQAVLKLPLDVQRLETPQLVNRFMRPMLNKAWQRRHLRSQPWLDEETLSIQGQDEWV